MVQKRLRLLPIFHFATDALLIGLVWLGAYGIRSQFNRQIGFALNPFSEYVQVLPLIVLIWLFPCWFFGVYQHSRHQTGVERTLRLLKSVLLGLLLSSSIAFYFKEYRLGRSVILLSGFLNFCILSLSYYGFSQFVLRFNTSRIRTLILGTNASSIRLFDTLMESKEPPYEIVGFVDPDATCDDTLFHNTTVLRSSLPLRDLIQQHHINEVFVALPSWDHQQLFPMVLDCEDLDVGFWLLTNELKALNRERSDLPRIEGVPLNYFGLQQSSVLYPRAKRVFDFSVSLVLLLLSLPFWLWWCIRIKLDSSGSVFFTQTRVGHHGKQFEMYKFRTMRSDVDPYEVSPQDAGDQRITTYGKWLRRTSIDEVPQLINVLKGEMSLVGPRPEMPFIVETYEDWQRCRLRVKPGLTGLWQILGRKDLPMHENLQYDFYYIRNRSLLLDLSILLRTVSTVFGGKGAY